MAKKDYYEVLSIERNASQEEMKKAYKRLAFQFHPDRNPGDSKAESKFKEINEAYQILSNPNKRAQYDSFGHMSSEGLFTESDFGVNFSDIFGNIFEEVFSTGRRSRAERGRDLKYDLEVSFEEAAFGVEREITIPKRIICEKCEGRGAAPGGETTCTTCGGRGSIKYSEGFLAISRTCSSCRGTGRRITKYCPSCKGDGLITFDQTLRVKVPAGIDEGARLRMRGEGEHGSYGGPSGDLYIEIHVKQHPFFTREGRDILCDVPISFVQAILGDEIEVPTLEGKTKIKIPSGTQSGQTLRLKEKGVPSLNGRGKGDLFIKVQVEVPMRLNSKQRELLEEFAKVSEADSSSRVGRFFDKLQEFFGQ